MINFNIPTWFLEGDAIDTETVFTQSGRGRIPHFSHLYRTNLLTRKQFSYTKQILGSFKDPVPDHYRVGYYLTTHLRRKYGSMVIANIMQRTTTLPILFNIAVMRETHNSISTIYRDANQELKKLWEAQLKNIQLTQVAKLNTRTHTNYTCLLYTSPSPRD